MSPSLVVRPFGTLPGGQEVEAYTLTGAGGLSLHVITYGGIVTRLYAPDRRGDRGDVVLGFDHLEDYLADRAYFGAIAGRIAGRVTGGRFALEGRIVQLACNDPPNHLSGGRVGLHQRLWQAQPVDRPDGAPALRLTYHSPDGEENYPGAIDIAVTYSVTSDNAFVIDTEAVADRVTPLNLTHHSYFNLAGAAGGSIGDHELQIHADDFAPADERMTLLGRRVPVAGQPNDFNRARRLGDVIPHLHQRHGDLYFLRRPAEAGRVASPLVPAARLSDPATGRVLSVATTESCLQLYTASAFDGTILGKSGQAYGRHAGVCLECAGYADAVNHRALGDIFLQPGVPKRHTTVYSFSTC